MLRADPRAPLPRAPFPQPAERGFWFNNVTGESSWKEPEALGIPAAAGTQGEGHRYWVVDGKPSWEAPEEYAWRSLASAEGADGRPYFQNTVTQAVTWERPAALGWSRRSVSKTFWYNAVTGESRREPPTDVVGFEHESGQRYFAGADGAATWDKPAAGAWTEARSEEHDRPYFHNAVTGETVWERPPNSNVAWQLYHEEL
jgi:hypothetical protein